MKKLFCSLLLIAMTGVMYAGDGFAADGAFSCGPGYVLTTRSSKIDGINAKECVKLWCRDLETNKPMGVGNRVSSGYRDVLWYATDGVETVECFGDRKWCSGDVPGNWSPEFGAYTRGNDDSTTYKSYQKGGCFSWRLEKPSCPSGQDAILLNNEWVCGTSTQESGVGSHAASVRRTGVLRRSVR